jgi:hypothetical protein
VGELGRQQVFYCLLLCLSNTYNAMHMLQVRPAQPCPCIQYLVLSVSVADPNPDPDPHVFGPPDPLVWSRILLSSCKNSKKNIDSYYFVTLFDFLSLKNDVNVASKSNKQKKLC